MAYWKGKIDLMGIGIPIKVDGAVDKHGTVFNNMSSCCGAFTGMVTVCKGCGKELSRDEIKKGFFDGKTLQEVNRDTLNAIKENTTHEIKIEGFMKQGDLSPIYFKGNHYLVTVDERKDKQTKMIIPDVQGRMMYKLFYEGLHQNRLVGIGRIVFRTGREDIVAISPYREGLLLSTLYYEEYIRDRMGHYMFLDEVNVDKKKVKETVVAFKNMQRVKLKDFVDNYEKRLQDIINGKEVVVEKKKEETTSWDMLIGQYAKKWK